MSTGIPVVKLTEAEYQVVVSLDERSRCFLVKQGHAATVCQLNLRGMDDALAVISASTDNIDIMHQVVEKASHRTGISVDELSPDAWLQVIPSRYGHDAFLKETTAIAAALNTALDD